VDRLDRHTLQNPAISDDQIFRDIPGLDLLQERP